MSGAQSPMQGWSLLVPLVAATLGLSAFAYMTANAMAYADNGPSSARVELIRRGLAVAISITLLGVLIGSPIFLAIIGNDSVERVTLLVIPMVLIVLLRLRQQLRLFSQLYKKSVTHVASPGDKL